jgi:sulfur relay (sulfurtransferase) complex TusBCD TusD component (DsrE family)
MKRALSLVVVVSCLLFAVSAFAQEKEGLLINLTSDDDWTASMAVHFGQQTLEKVPVVIYMNVRAVRLADKNNNDAKAVQERLQGFMEAGGKVEVCPMCSKRAGLTEADLIEGVTWAGEQTIDMALSNVQIMSY